MGSLGIILICAAALVGVGIVVYNGLVTKKIAVENAWSQIEVQLKRRYDLIPNLVETVKGYAKHEQETLQKVIAARNSAMQVAQSGSTEQRIAAEGALSGAMRQLFALSEAYPDLKANQNFSQLQAELTTTEDKISISRNQYNEAVRDYNTAVQQVPGNFVASIAGFTAKPFFEVSAEEKQAVQAAPKVSF